MSEQSDGFFDGGWAWMTHPSYNDGNPIPVKMIEVDGVRWYHPLDPRDATEFEWERRDSEWQMVVPPVAATLIDAAPDLLAVLQDALDSGFDPDKALAAIAKATGVPQP